MSQSGLDVPWVKLMLFVKVQAGSEPFDWSDRSIATVLLVFGRE